MHIFACDDVDMVQVQTRKGIKFDCISTYKLQTRTHCRQLGAKAFDFQLARSMCDFQSIFIGDGMGSRAGCFDIYSIKGIISYCLHFFQRKSVNNWFAAKPKWFQFRNYANLRFFLSRLFNKERKLRWTEVHWILPINSGFSLIN